MSLCHQNILYSKTIAVKYCNRIYYIYIYIYDIWKLMTSSISQELPRKSMRILVLTLPTLLPLLRRNNVVS